MYLVRNSQVVSTGLPQTIFMIAKETGWGTNYVRDLLKNATDDELRELGVYRQAYNAGPEGVNDTFTRTEVVFKYDADTDRVLAENTLVETELELEDAKVLLKDKLAKIRWEHETKGISVGSVDIPTDDRAKSLLLGAYTLVTAAPQDVQFKGKNGWRSMDVESTKGAVVAMAKHVEQCFKRERQLSDQIDSASTVDDLKSVDLNSGWPTGEM